MKSKIVPTALIAVLSFLVIHIQVADAMARKASAPIPRTNQDQMRSLPRCSVHVWTNLEASAPNKVSSSLIRSIGGVWYSAFSGGPTVSAYCGSIALRVEAQSKVCGFWGCSYHSRGDWGYSSDGRTTSPWRRYAYQDCREGTHRYRTKTFFQYGWIQFDWQEPIGSTVSSFSGAEPLLTCGS